MVSTIFPDPKTGWGVSFALAAGPGAAPGEAAAEPFIPDLGDARATAATSTTSNTDSVIVRRIFDSWEKFSTAYFFSPFRINSFPVDRPLKKAPGSGASSA